MKRTLFLTLIVLSFTVAGFADIARPDPTPAKTPKAAKSVKMYMSIRLNKDAKEATLRIPKSALKQLRAAIDDMDQDENTAATVPTESISRTQTIVSGAFLSLALVFGGVWFMRSGKLSSGTAKSLVILAVIAGVSSAATFVYANAGPPAEARSITGKMFTPALHVYGFGGGDIKLEAKDDQSGVELIVPDPPSANKPSDEE